MEEANQLSTQVYRVHETTEQRTCKIQILSTPGPEFFELCDVLSGPPYVNFLTVPQSQRLCNVLSGLPYVYLLQAVDGPLMRGDKRRGICTMRRRHHVLRHCYT